MKSTFLASAIVLLVVIISSCGKQTDYAAEADCSAVVTTTNTYTANIKAIIDGSCAYVGCHSAKEKAGVINLSDYATARASFVDGTSLCSIYHDCEKMPKDGSKLPSDIINELACWVKNGAKQ